RVLSDFSMPGDQIPNFRRRAVEIARAGIYNLRIHAEQVVQPLLRHWQVDRIGGLTGGDAEAQDGLMGIPALLITQAEHFEARLARRGA
ncbi:MAG: acyl-ACP desaturase, partial [Acidimicrobiales bacterium]|nr:acyl-ACP desaturase [Acidimicrobiales bacterium]